MPQRNGQNPIKSGGSFGKSGGPSNDPAGARMKQENTVGTCPSCGAEVPPKPGFRPSSLKCPKCGAAMVKK